MKEEDIKQITDSIKEKLGEETYATISDDIGILFTKNTEVQNQIVELNENVNGLTEKNSKLASANASLLQQVPMGLDNSKPSQIDEESKEPFNFKSLFDEKGNFKKTL